MPYNARKRKNQRAMNTARAVERLFGNRKHRPCSYCGRKLSAADATFDHVKPLSQGGYDKTKNGAIACEQCNQAKGSMTVDEFKRRMKGML